MEPAQQHEPDLSRIAAPRDRLADFRTARAMIERGVPPLANSVDGSRFEFQTSLDDLALEAGGQVILETGGAGRLGQVLTLRIAQVDAAVPRRRDPAGAAERDPCLADQEPAGLRRPRDR